jgi:hypothetical protein
MGCGGSAAGGPSPPLATACPRIPLQRIEALVRGSGGSPGSIKRAAGGSALLSTCSFRARGASLRLSLDAERHAVRGYFNRMTEFHQFSARGPGLTPLPVPGVGDRGTPGYGANWLPAFDQLFSVRKRRLLIATFFVHGASARQARTGAIALTRLAYAALGLPRASAAP